METIYSLFRKSRGLLLVILILGAISACGSGNDRLYYVSLGDSLAASIQPGPDGQNIETTEGYAEQLFAILAANNPNLELVKFGCPGETTVTMIEGGICDYPAGSQLDEAAQFLVNNRDNIFLVTYDIGVNDILSSDCIDQSASPPVVDVECLQALFPVIGSNLSIIAGTLFSAVNADTPVIGMNYYNTFLALWFLGPEGQLLAQLSDQLVQAFDFSVIMPVNDLYGFPTANVYGAFDAGNFTDTVQFPPFGQVPINVITLCQLTGMCPPPGSGIPPNIHPNTDGYAVITQAFVAVLSSLGIQ